MLLTETGGVLGIALLFWILFIIGLVFGGYRQRTAIGTWFADSLFWWILIFLLGIGVFGFPIKL